MYSQPNYVYLKNIDGIQYIVKNNSDKNSHIGIELELTSYFNQMFPGFAPHLLIPYCNKNQIVMEYIPFKNMKAESYLSDVYYSQILKMLSKIMHTPVKYDLLIENKKLLFKKLKFIESLLRDNGYVKLDLYIEIENYIIKCEDCIIHGDMNYGNILIDKQDKIYLIDFEYLTRGPKYFDLTYFISDILFKVTDGKKFYCDTVDIFPIKVNCNSPKMFLKLLGFNLLTRIIQNPWCKKRYSIDRYQNLVNLSTNMMNGIFIGTEKLIMLQS